MPRLVLCAALALSLALASRAAEPHSAPQQGQLVRVEPQAGTVTLASDGAEHTYTLTPETALQATTSAGTFAIDAVPDRVSTRRKLTDLEIVAHRLEHPAFQVGAPATFTPGPGDTLLSLQIEPRLEQVYALTSLFAWLGLPAELAGLAALLTSALLLLGFVAVSAIFFIWLERKVAGRIQDRLGPTRVGGKFGWLQTIADGIKLLVKEDLIPGDADPVLFRLGPYIAFCGSFAAFIALPFAAGWSAFTSGLGAFTIGVYFMLAVMSTEVFGIILAGYGSGSKWALFGGMREAAQMVSYEVPMALCVLVPVVVAGTMDLGRIALNQGGFFWNWYLFRDPFTFLAFWTYFTCATASCKRAPFDLAEAESELVAGFHTEYSGLRWSFFFMAEYATMFAVSGIAALLFLGGWNSGLVPAELSTLPALAWPFPVLNVGNLINGVVLVLKAWLLVFVMMWVRWTLPRLRIDQVMMTCLKYLLPISSFLLVGVSVWEVLVRPHVGLLVNFTLAGLSVLALVWMLIAILLTPNQLPPTGVAASGAPVFPPDDLSSRT
ncbi:MAG: NADH-quinone oxidoreductase subunit NuoH [Gemmataceae bacterium]